MEHELCRIHYLQYAVWYAHTQSHTSQCEKMSLASNIPSFVNYLIPPALLAWKCLYYIYRANGKADLLRNKISINI